MEREKESAWTQVTLPSPTLNECGWHDLHLRRKGGTRKTTSKLGPRACFTAGTGSVVALPKSTPEPPTANEKGKVERLDALFGASSHHSPPTYMLPVEPGAQEARQRPPGPLRWRHTGSRSWFAAA